MSQMDFTDADSTGKTSVEMSEHTQIPSSLSHGHGQPGQPSPCHSTLTVPTRHSISVQCSVCNLEIHDHETGFQEPDANNILFKLLDVNGQSVLDHQCVPLCSSCTTKLKNYDRLLLDLNYIQNEIVTAVVNTLMQMSAIVHNPPCPSLNLVRNEILDRWLEPGKTQQKPVTRPPGRPGARFSEPEEPPKCMGPVPPLELPTPTETVEERTSMVLAPNMQNVGVISWVTSDVSIVAESDLEVQEILHAFVTGNVIQEDVRTLKNQEGTSEMFELTECFPDPTTHVTITTSNEQGHFYDSSDVNSKVAKNKPKGAIAKRKCVGSNRKPATTVRLPQHEIPPYFCEKCGRVYSKFSTLRIHKKTCEVQTAEDEVISCSICTEIMSSWLHLKFHFDEVHPNLTLDKCRFCKKEFLPFTIDNHICIHPVPTEGGTELKTHACDHCHKLYYKYTSLTEHVRRSHPNTSKFECTICHRQFVTKAAKEDHEKIHSVIQDGKRTHACVTCGIVCTTAWGLREHSKLHTGSRPYECEICGKTFRLQNIKRNHMVVHTKEKNFECELCGRSYSLYATMYRHWKKCQLPSIPRRGRRCPICQPHGILFQKLSSLKIHMLKIHPGTKEQLQICQETGNREFGFEEIETPQPHTSREDLEHVPAHYNTVIQDNPSAHEVQTVVEFPEDSITQTQVQFIPEKETIIVKIDNKILRRSNRRKPSKNVRLAR